MNSDIGQEWYSILQTCPPRTGTGRVGQYNLDEFTETIWAYLIADH